MRTGPLKGLSRLARSTANLNPFAVEADSANWLSRWIEIHHRNLRDAELSFRQLHDFETV